MVPTPGTASPTDVPDGLEAVELGETDCEISCLLDDASSAFVMYSAEPVDTRFGILPTERSRSCHLACVFLVEGTERRKAQVWMVHTIGATEPSGFVRRGSDLLVAEIDVASGSVSLLKGVVLWVEAIRGGWQSGNLEIVQVNHQRPIA